MTVYVSMPLRGPEAVEGRDVVGGAKLALADAHGKVGELAVRAVYLDDTAGRGAARSLEPRRWPPRTPGRRRRTRRRSPTLATSTPAPAGSRCRSPTRRGCSRSPRPAARSTWRSRSSAPATSFPRTSSRAASAPSAGSSPATPCRLRPPRSGRSGLAPAASARCRTGRTSATRWSRRSGRPRLACPAPDRAGRTSSTTAAPPPTFPCRSSATSPRARGRR